MQMDELTQQNAALVEEATAASQAMADQARELNEMMNRYRVRQTAGEEAATTTPPAANAGRNGSGENQATDRRSPARPWKAREKKASEAPVSARRIAANATGDSDSDWKEF
jgi:methyl-accepting chemotaxis protein